MGMRATVSDFLRYIVLARDSGYNRVEIMGSEGYLINQFLVARANQRNDECGGDCFANRMRLDVDIVRDTWEACGPGYTIIFHISLLDLLEGGSTWEEVKVLAQTLEDADVTIINTGIGWRDAKIRE